eukprot:7451414-Pyramimonas_sp.AAC.1
MTTPANGPPLTRFGTDELASECLLGRCAHSGDSMLSSALRLVPTPGICFIVPCDWFQPLEYALYCPAIGSNPWNILSSALRLVPTPEICYLVPCDWFKPLEYVAESDTPLS